MQTTVHAPPHALVGKWRAVAAAWNHAVPARCTRGWGWAVVGLLFVGQFWLFVRFAEREVTCAYPPAFDQLAYLLQTYGLAEDIRTQGPATAIWQGISSGEIGKAANGMLLQTQAAVVCAYAGTNRTNALLVNLAYLLLFEFVLVALLRWVTRAWSIPLIGLGLMLSAITSFRYPGGMFDFRLDFAAMCLFGCFVCAVVRSGPFLHRGWSALAGGVGGLMVVERTITTLHLTGTLGLAGLALVVRLLLVRRDPAGRHLVGRQIACLLLTAACAAVIGLPYLYSIRQHLYDYYVVNHVIGPERAIRLHEAGTTTFLRHLVFYPQVLISEQLGKRFVALGLLTLVGAGIITWRSVATFRQRTLVRADLWAPLTFVGGCLLAPAMVLTIHAVKSPVVCSILVPGSLALVLTSLVVATRLVAPGGPARRQNAALGVMAAVVLTSGAYVQIKHQYRSDLFSSRMADTAAIVDMFDTLQATAQSRRWPAPIVACDEVSEKLNWAIARLMLYERHGRWTTMRQTLGSSLYAIDERQALAQAEQGDFVICTRTKHNYLSPYPFDESMRQIKPALAAWCRMHLELLTTISLADEDVDLFVRPANVAAMDDKEHRR